MTLGIAVFTFISNAIGRETGLLLKKGWQSTVSSGSDLTFVRTVAA